MPTFLTFDEFNDVLARSAGMLVFVITAECDDEGAQQGRFVEQTVGQVATVHLLCAAVTPSPKLAWYEGGDTRLLITSQGSSPHEVLEALQEAQRVAATRPGVAEEKARVAALIPGEFRRWHHRCAKEMHGRERAHRLLHESSLPRALIATFRRDHEHEHAR